MTWQDIAIAIVGLSFTFALIPSILGPKKPALATCCMTFAGLVWIAFALATLSMWGAAASNFCCAAGWFVLMMQSREEVNAKDH